MASQAGVSRQEGREGVVADALTVTVRDSGATVEALRACGVPVLTDPESVMASLYGVIEDPERARVVTRERRRGLVKTHLRTWWWLWLVAASAVIRTVWG